MRIVLQVQLVSCFALIVASVFTHFLRQFVTFSWQLVSLWQMFLAASQLVPCPLMISVTAVIHEA
jgi:hypothetical protein